jgi:hypothetical protein
VVLASVEYIGIVKLHQQVFGTTVVWQSATTAKAFWTDDKLRAYGLYAPGMKHARDATRHYLYYQTFTLRNRGLLEGAPGQVKRLAGIL